MRRKRRHEKERAEKKRAKKWTEEKRSKPANQAVRKLRLISLAASSTAVRPCLSFPVPVLSLVFGMSPHTPFKNLCRCAN